MIVVENWLPPNPPSGDGVRWTQTWLTGDVWQNSTNTDWTEVPTQDSHAVTIGDAPAPDVASFIAAHWDFARDATIEPPNAGHFRLDEGVAGGTPIFYRTDKVDDERPNPQIDVKGTAIWLLKHGICLPHKITVNGTSADRLIIVTQEGTFAGPPLTHAGIWFDGSMDSPDVPVILVTDAALQLSAHTNFSSDSEISYLSIFAESVLLMGPEHGWMNGAEHPWMQLAHPSDRDTEVLGPLYEAGVLPNASTGAKGNLANLPGTWRQLSTSGL
jgi:hypothetical protein